MWRLPCHTPLAFLLQGQPCPWSSHRRRRRALHVGKSQGARQGPPYKLRAAERQIPARSIPHSCEETRSGVDRSPRSLKSTPEARSSGDRSPRSPKPAPAESRLRSHQARSGGKPTPVALNRLWWLSPAESRLRSHPRLYISVSPTLRGPAGNKTFSFVTR